MRLKKRVRRALARLGRYNPPHDLHVAPTGDDRATGAADDPLRTAQRALDILCPPFAPPQQWDHPRTVWVHGDLKENLVKQPHRGAALILQAAQPLTQTRTQVGAVTTLTGFKSRKTLPLDAGASLDGWFVAGPNPDQYGHAFAAGKSHTVVEAIGAAVEIAARVVDPVFTGGAELTFTRPTQTWTMPDLPAGEFGPLMPRILNLGGPLIVRDFTVSGLDATGFAGKRQNLVAGTGIPGREGGLDLVTFDRCLIQSFDRFMEGAPSCLFNACALDFGSAITKGAGWLRFTSCHITTSSGEWQIAQTRRVEFDGCQFERLAGTTNKLFVVGPGYTTMRGVDSRGNMDFLFHGADFNLVDVSIQDAGNTAIRALRGSRGSVQNVTGSPNNLYGLEIDSLSRVTATGTNTLTGNSGEVLVGGTAKLWTDAPVTVGLAVLE